MGNPILEAARRYAGLGLHVIPLSGKIPIFDNWYDAATRDESTIAKWWAQNPASNVGIATGIKSNVFVVDIDPRHRGDETYDSLVHKYGKQPPTCEVITGTNGRHLYYRMPNFDVRNAAGLFPGIDIRGTGGQVVGPPSIHPDTKQPYYWDGMKEIEEEEIAQAPDWLLDVLASKLQKKTKDQPVPVLIPKGVQHHTLVSLAGRLRSMGLTEEEMLPAMLIVNRTRCQEPGKEENIRDICRSMMRYQPHDRNLYSEAQRLWRMTGRLERAEQEQKSDEIKTIDAWTLLRNPPASPQVVVEGLLHNGLTIMAGPPKVGKSWFTLQLAMAVARNRTLAGFWPVNSPGGVLYWALEESASRTGSRIRKLTDVPDITLQNLEFVYESKPLLGGGLEQIDQKIGERRPSLVIIDTLLAVCRGTSGPAGKRNDVMGEDYQRIAVLQKLAHKHGTAIVVVHHTAKYSTGNDVIQSVAGSVGTTAAADCIWGMKRQPAGRCALEIKGREVEDDTFMMALDLSGPIGWNVVEQGNDANTSEERDEIVELIRDTGAISPAKIAAETRKKPVTVRSLLRRMVERGQLVRFESGTYGLATGATQKRQGWQTDDE